MSSTFGTLFRVTRFGESHGKAVGAIVDGCPANLELTEADIQPQLTRRRPGQSALTTPRDLRLQLTFVNVRTFCRRFYSFCVAKNGCG